MSDKDTAQPAKTSTANDPDKYYRAGIAIPMHRKERFEANMKVVGAETMGELVNAVIFATDEELPAIKAALEAPLKRYAEQKFMSPGATGAKKELLNELKGMTEEQVAQLLALARAKQSN